MSDRIDSVNQAVEFLRNVVSVGAKLSQEHLEQVIALLVNLRGKTMCSVGQVEGFRNCKMALENIIVYSNDPKAVEYAIGAISSIGLSAAAWDSVEKMHSDFDNPVILLKQLAAMNVGYSAQMPNRQQLDVLILRARAAVERLS